MQPQKQAVAATEPPVMRAKGDEAGSKALWVLPFGCAWHSSFCADIMSETTTQSIHQHSLSQSVSQPDTVSTFDPYARHSQYMHADAGEAKVAHRDIRKGSRGRSQASSKGTAIGPGQHFLQGAAVGADGEQDAACPGEPRQRLPFTSQEQPLRRVLQGDGYLAGGTCIRPQIACLCLQDVVLHIELQRTAQHSLLYPLYGRKDSPTPTVVALSLQKCDEKRAGEKGIMLGSSGLIGREDDCQAAATHTGATISFRIGHNALASIVGSQQAFPKPMASMMSRCMAMARCIIANSDDAAGRQSWMDSASNSTFVHCSELAGGIVQKSCPRALQPN